MRHAGGARPSLDSGLAHELDLWARLFGPERQREMMRAFLETRAPPPPLSRHGREAASAGFPLAGIVTQRSVGKRKTEETPGQD
ncbi:MAG: hypothetical protein ACLPWO_03895 [Thermoplasmata archaeon]